MELPGAAEKSCVQLPVGFKPPKPLSTKSCCLSLGKANTAEETQQPQPSAQAGQEALEVTSSLNHLEEATNSHYQETMTTIHVIPAVVRTPYLFVSFCSAGFFVGPDFFRTKARDPHVPLALWNSQNALSWKRH